MSELKVEGFPSRGISGATYGILRKIALGPFNPAKVPLAAHLYQPLLHRFLPNPVFAILLEVEGVKIYASALDFSVSHALLTNRSYENLTTELLKHELKPGMTVIDIGAHIGYFSLLAAKIVGQDGKVFAFEPNKNLLDLLLRSIHANGFMNVVAVPKAVFNRTGKFKLPLAPWSRAKEIETVCLDDFFAGLDCNIDFIKMDIDGAEPFALEGMRSAIKKNPRLRMVTEYAPGALRRHGNSPALYLKSLADLGFEIEAVFDETRNCTRPQGDVTGTLADGEFMNLFLTRDCL